MTYQLRVNNPQLDILAVRCGTIIANEHYDATSKELEFLMEEVVRECAMLANCGHSGTFIKNYFNIN